MLSKYCIYSKMNIDRINNIPIVSISKYIVHITTTTTYKLLLTTYLQQRIKTTYLRLTYLLTYKDHFTTYIHTTYIQPYNSNNLQIFEKLEISRKYVLFGEDETLSVRTVSFQGRRYLVLQNHAYLRYGVNGSERTDGIRDRSMDYRIKDTMVYDIDVSG